VLKNIRNPKIFRIENEFDLQVKVVSYIRANFKKVILVASLGENQTTKDIRMRSRMLGYEPGTPDLIIVNSSEDKKYKGFAIEFKSPTGLGIISPSQKKCLRKFKKCGYKILVSNDYDQIIEELITYLQERVIEVDINDLNIYE
jgi:hypothetical protein